jgi:hypothetical protein
MAACLEDLGPSPTQPVPLGRTLTSELQCFPADTSELNRALLKWPG